MDFNLELEKMKHLRDNFAESSDPKRKIRVGRVLEDIECTATKLAYDHCEGFSHKRPISIVCAFMERIEGLSSLQVDKDIQIQGRVVDTGKSSMKIEMDVKQEDTKTDISACFTMVAREYKEEKAVLIHKIEPMNEKEIELNQKYHSEEYNQRINQVMVPIIEIAKINKRQYQKKKKSSEEEIFEQQLVEFFEDEGIPIGNTLLDSTIMLHKSRININNKIPAGVLLKKGIELAYLNAMQFCNSNVKILSIDDCAFLRPVFVGTICSFSSRVVFVEDHSFTLRVDVEALDFQKKNSIPDIITVFHITCGTESINTNNVRPCNYRESFMFLEGKRIHKKDENQKLIKTFGESLLIMKEEEKQDLSP